MKKILVLSISVILSFATFAQTDTTQKSSAKSTTARQASYTCAMHPEVISNKPGKCPKCGMTLTKVKSYSCSMHPEIISDKPGKCPKCGMNLTEIKSHPKTKKS